MNVFINKEGKLRELWWVGIFYLILGVFTISLIFIGRAYSFEITLLHQATIVAITSVICVLLYHRKLPSYQIDFSELTTFGKGLFIGFLLMAIPSAFLILGGWVTFEFQEFNTVLLLSVSFELALGAITEELLFRGFVFQRFLRGLGQWPAQIILSLYFLLTHVGNPGLNDSVHTLAMINIFAASLIFGIIVIKTKDLIAAVAAHFAANWTQGVLFGFGVSGGHTNQSIFHPITRTASEWITGGTFGLEGSLPGTITVVLALIVLYTTRGLKS